MSHTTRQQGGRLLLGALLVTSLAAGGCESEVRVANAAPRLTWVAVQAPAADTGIAEVTIWIADVEGDSVDVEATVVQGASAPVPMTMEPGGHGLNGLTTREARFDQNGQPHLLLWNTSDVDGSSVKLQFVPDDLRGGKGPAVTTPSFELHQGLAVTILEAME